MQAEAALDPALAVELLARLGDDGALFIVAKDDRKMRIEVGYGLEGVLTDATSRRIIAETVAPLFQQNRFADGIDAGVDRIIEVVGTGQPLPAQRSPSRPAPGFDFGTLLVLLFVGVPILGGILSRIFGRMLGSTVGAGVLMAAEASDAPRSGQRRAFSDARSRSPRTNRGNAATRSVRRRGGCQG